MALIAFYGGLLVGALAGMVLMALLSMAGEEEGTREPDRR